MIRTLTLLAFLLFVNNCIAQKRFTYPRYGFGLGTQTGWGHLQPELNNSLILGLNGVYQRNYIEWFSLRFELGYAHYFKVPKSTFTSFVIGDIEPIYVEEESEIYFSANQFYLSLSPIFYLRDGKMNYYLGFHAGVGALILQWNGVIETRISNTNDQIQYPKGNSFFGIFGLSPVMGITYSLGRKSRPSSELDFQVIWDNWYNRSKHSPVLPESYLAIKSFALQFTYRILLEK